MRRGLVLCLLQYLFNGVLSANYKNRTKDALKSFGLGHMPVFGSGTSAADAANNGCFSRKFVAGEKFWITGVTAQKDGILISTFSDPYPDASGNQARFYGEIKFPFAKGSVPSPDDFVERSQKSLRLRRRTIQGGQGGQGAARQDQPAQSAAPPAAPTPPPAPMQTLRPHRRRPIRLRRQSSGQTKEQVIAAFGQPTRMAKLGAKEILYYKDMKVTLTNGKVSNVE